MAVQLSLSLRLNMLNNNIAITEVLNFTLSGGSSGNGTILFIFTGAPPVDCQASPTGTELAALNPIPNAPTPFTPTTTGSTTMYEAAGVPVSPTNPLSFVAGVSGTAGYFRLTDSTPTCHIQGTCGTPGSGADLIMSTTAIMSGQTLVITDFTFTAPGA